MLPKSPLVLNLNTHQMGKHERVVQWQIALGKLGNKWSHKHTSDLE